MNKIAAAAIPDDLMLCRQLVGSKKQLLIVPLTFWSGLEQGFFGADFTAVHKSSHFSPFRIKLNLRSLAKFRIWLNNMFHPASHYRASSLVPLEFTLLVESSSFMAASMLFPPFLLGSFAGKTLKLFYWRICDGTFFLQGRWDVSPFSFWQLPSTWPSLSPCWWSLYVAGPIMFT